MADDPPAVYASTPRCRSTALAMVVLAIAGYASGAIAQAPRLTAADLLGGREAVPRDPRPFQGCFSPDGRWIYYGTDEPDPALWRIPTSGGNPERLAVAPRGTAWLDLSPDGRTLALDHAGTGDDYDVSLFHLEEKRLAPLAATSARERFPAWCPVGEGLLYIRRSTIRKRGESSPAELVVHGNDASPRFVVPLDDVRCNAAWSGDGKSILLFRYIVAQDHCELVRMTIPGLDNGAEPRSNNAPTRVDALIEEVLAVLVGEDVFDLRIAKGGRHATFARGFGRTEGAHTIGCVFDLQKIRLRPWLHRVPGLCMMTGAWHPDGKSALVPYDLLEDDVSGIRLVSFPDELLGEPPAIQPTRPIAANTLLWLRWPDDASRRGTPFPVDDPYRLESAAPDGSPRTPSSASLAGIVPGRSADGGKLEQSGGQDMDRHGVDSGPGRRG